MRRVHKPKLFEIGHDVAHRGRRQGHRDQARQIARADRLAGREITFDDLAEDLARAFVELREARLARSEGNLLGHRPLSPSWSQNCPAGRPKTSLVVTDGAT